MNSPQYSYTYLCIVLHVVLMYDFLIHYVKILPIQRDFYKLFLPQKPVHNSFYIAYIQHRFLGK